MLRAIKSRIQSITSAPVAQRHQFRINQLHLAKMSSSSSTLPPCPDGYLRVKEGSVYMDYDEKEAVFYNKVQEFNRDTSVQVIRLFAEQREAEKKAKYNKRNDKWNAICRQQ